MNKPVEKVLRIGKRKKEMLAFFASSALEGLCSNPAICPELLVTEDKIAAIAQTALRIAEAMAGVRHPDSAKQAPKAAAKSGTQGKATRTKAPQV